MTDTNDNWPCSIAGCTRESRVCDKMMGLPTDPEKEVVFTFPQVPGGEDHAYCEEMWRSLIHHYRLKEQDEGDEDAEEGADDVTPRSIYDGLTERVFGQNPALKTLATMIFEELYVKPELRRAETILEEGRLKVEDIRKNNGIIVGPTGSGKTYMLQVAASLLGIPFFLYRNTAGLTEAGYVGSDVDEIILHALLHTQNWLRQHGEGDVGIEELVERINTGQQRLMIGLDEFDKLAKPDDTRGIGRDVSGGGVQNALLTLLEGQEVAVNLGSRQAPQTVMVDTTFIAFIAVGAFSDGPNGPVTNFIKSDMGGTVGIEPSSPREDEEDVSSEIDLYMKVQKKHLKKFGFNNQILGRLSALIRLRPLKEDDLVFIMKEMAGNPLDRYRAQYRIRGFDVEFSEEAIGLIAKRAVGKNTGARGLDEVMSELFRDVSFEAESRKAEGCNSIFISAEMVKKRGKLFEEGNEEGVPPTFRQVERLQMVDMEAPPPPAADIPDEDHDDSDDEPDDGSDDGLDDEDPDND